MGSVISRIMQARIVSPVYPYPANTAWTNVSRPTVIKPGYIRTLIDPDFGSEIIRITDDVVFGAANVRHHYSKTSPWNSDMTIVRIKDWIIDAKSMQILEYRSRPSEFCWAHTDRRYEYGVSWSARNVRRYDVTNGFSYVTIRSMTEYDEIWKGPGEGTIDNNDQYMALACKSGNNLVVNVLELQTGNIHSSRTFTNGWSNGFDFVTMSQDGNYVVINWFNGASGGVSSYSRATMADVATLAPQGEHGDCGVDSNGNQVWIQILPTIDMYRLDNGTKTTIFPNVGGGHISCRNIDRPGWAYVTSRDDEIFAVKLDGSQTVNRFCHHQSYYYEYDDHPHAVVSRDGKQIIFASNWQNAGSRNSYLTRMPYL